MANTTRDTFELEQGNDHASAKEVPLTSAQKETITKAIVQAIADEAKLPNLGFWKFGFGRFR